VDLGGEEKVSLDLSLPEAAAVAEALAERAQYLRASAAYDLDQASDPSLAEEARVRWITDGFRRLVSAVHAENVASRLCPTLGIDTQVFLMEHL
jgi:hypothetical protein